MMEGEAPVLSRLRTDQGRRIRCGRAQPVDEGADKSDPGKIAQSLARPRVRTDLPTSDRPVEIVSGLDPCTEVRGSSGRPQIPPEDVAPTLQHATHLLGGVFPKRRRGDVGEANELGREIEVFGIEWDRDA